MTEMGGARHDPHATAMASSRGTPLHGEGGVVARPVTTSAMLDTQLLVRRDDVDDDVVTLEIDRQVARAVLIYLYQVGDHFAAGALLGEPERHNQPAGRAG
jgi:hypothetical protein